MAKRRDTMPLFSDPQFVALMDAWYALQQRIVVNSVVWAGHYGHASDYFEKYMRRTANKKQKFDSGYPFTVQRIERTQEVLVGQWFDDDGLWASFPVQHAMTPDEFVRHVRQNLVFVHEDGVKYLPGDDFYEDSLRPEMEQLFSDL
jgi:hypothetical protein